MYKNKANTGLAILFLLAGIVVGGFIGELFGRIPFMSWLNYGADFGLTKPLKLDLGVIAISLGLSIRFTISGIIGMAVGVFLYRKF